MARASEDELIARHLAPLAGAGALGLKDDAALLTPKAGHDLVLTVDAVVEGVHFLPGDPPGSVAAKALGVNLSDLAAKGAEPAGFLMVLALPDDWTEPWLSAFCEGLGRASRAGTCPLLGGDTVRAAGPLSISVTAFGQVPSGTMVRRTAAQPGDLVAVTGTIGDAVLGLALLGEKPPAWRDCLSEDETGFLTGRYREPRPRLAWAGALREHAHAAMDVSDGLAGDAAKLLGASGLGGGLDLDQIPYSAAAAKVLEADPGWRDRLVTGGDDYELLFTFPEAAGPALRQRAVETGLPMTVIGRVGEKGGAVSFLSAGCEYRFSRTSFQHFGAA
ncbi:thiamine-phosphate kinase [Enterovirga sp.]|uniref:thiamine-phosphate kinase n=1 Tax=Enterovirga sp. TaxID=2026350 RepID=UPI002CDE2BB4|nr:thiamine-phosphate kinase [Enterovirga sp.]HMO31278.1 thiamine-phosphate kinase [Enterovirga sp.]